MTGHLKGPYVDWAAISPMAALAIGAILALLIGLFKDRGIRTTVVPAFSAGTLVTAIVFSATRIPHQRASVVAGSLAMDDLAYILDLIFCVSALAAVVLSWRDHAASEAGHGEYHATLLFSVLGMTVLVSAQNLVTVFLGLELLSIPLYVLCASESRRENSLESGLKYLVVGSVGSATLLYGFAMLYGATGSTFFSGIARAIVNHGVLGDPLLLTGIALVVAGFSFKASVAPFHQWTPDVYEGAPTPITVFMATATKAAALGVFLRFFDVAVISQQNTWGPALAILAAVTIIVGNVGALGQSSLKRMLAYSGVAQAGYMLGGVVVGTRLGVRATVFYLAVYLAMNVAAFAVIVAREREFRTTADAPEGRADSGDDIRSLAGLGARRPALAAALTVAMLGLAGIPGTVGFIGKFQLIRALIDGNYTWLAIVLVIGSMLSLAYYLRVVASIWMSSPEARRTAPVALGAVPVGGLSGAGSRPVIAGGSPELDVPGFGGYGGPGGSGLSRERDPGTGGTAMGPAVGADSVGSEGGSAPEAVAVAVLFAVASIFFGIIPSPLFHLVAHVSSSLSGLL